MNAGFGSRFLYLSAGSVQIDILESLENVWQNVCLAFGNVYICHIKMNAYGDNGR